MEIDPKDLDLPYDQPLTDNDDDDDAYEEDESIGSEDRNKLHADLPTEELPGSENKPIAAPTDFHQVKWNRLRKHYSDDYLELFNESCTDDVLNDSSDLHRTRHGAVTWTSEEKKRLFAALARYGRHDLPSLSAAVATKSQIEVVVYIKNIAEAETDRQLFMASAKNIALCDIPAAVEIGGQCDAMLTRAANALCAYQEQYDISANQNEQGHDWLIDRSIAAQLDAENDHMEEVQLDDSERELHQDDSDDGDVDDENCSRLFRLSNGLDLCEQFFMNRSPDDHHEHWSHIAEPGQRPAVTRDAIQNMHTLVKERVQRILDVVIQIVDARRTQLTSVNYTPVERVTKSDVEAALDVLDAPRDSWQFWAGLPRRNGFRVVTGSHSKGESRWQSIAWDDAEAVLLQRKGRGRRRSMSVGSRASSTTGSQSSDIRSVSDAVSDYCDTTEHDTEGEEVESISEDSDDSDRVKKSPNSSGTNMAVENKSDLKMSGEQRRIHLEEAQHNYAEQVDQVARVKEERHLWKVLGKRARSGLKEEGDFIVGSRPKTLRKTREELEDWSCNYEAEWEQLGRASMNLGMSDEPPDAEATSEGLVEQETR